jgi:phage terminase small subunit
VTDTKRKLTDRQERFVVEYLACANGAEAARRAGYSEHTARQMANENLSKPDIKAAITQKREQIMSETEDKVEWLINRLTSEAIDDGNGEATRVRALEVLGKIYGAFAPEKQEVTTYSGAFLADLDLDEAQFEALPEEKPNELSDLH